MGWWEAGDGIIYGDGPADVMGEAVDNILKRLGLAVPKPGSDEKVLGISSDELQAILLAGRVPTRFGSSADDVLHIVADAWLAIDEEYEEGLERASTVEERAEGFRFVTRPVFTA